MPIKVYLTIRELDGRSEPAMVRRRGCRSLIAWDPRATRMDITACLIDILEPEEKAVLRAGLGCPNLPLPNWCVVPRPAFLFVPRALRLYGDPPFQGGAELLRRHRLGQLRLEQAAYRAEVSGQKIDLDLVDRLAAAA